MLTIEKCRKVLKLPENYFVDEILFFLASDSADDDGVFQILASIRAKDGSTWHQHVHLSLDSLMTKFEVGNRPRWKPSKCGCSAKNVENIVAGQSVVAISSKMPTMGAYKFKPLDRNCFLLEIADYTNEEIDELLQSLEAELYYAFKTNRLVVEKDRIGVVDVNAKFDGFDALMGKIFELIEANGDCQIIVSSNCSELRKLIGDDVNIYRGFMPCKLSTWWQHLTTVLRTERTKSDLAKHLRNCWSTVVSVPSRSHRLKCK